MRLRTLGLILLLATTAVPAVSAAADVPPDRIAAVLDAQTPAPSGRIVIKFAAESGLTVGPAGLATDAAVGRTTAAAVGDPQVRAGRVRSLLARIAPGRDLQRHFSASPAKVDAIRIAAESRSGRALPDLNRYARLDPGIPASDRGRLLELLAELLASPDIETAYLEPKAVPAALGFDAFTETYEPPPRDPGEPVVLLESGNFQPYQGYLGTPPNGMNVLLAEAYPGGTGTGSRVIDIEGGWYWAHEDIPSPFHASGGFIDEIEWIDHGTAVVAEIVGIDNDIGVRGVAPGSQAGGVAVAYYSAADAILVATMELSPGDVILIELHAPGPFANGVGQFGYLPMEYWRDTFDAIQVATAAGYVVCEAGGNGEQNLDSPSYEDLFNRDIRDSGAILVGATDQPNNPSSFTNFGSRIDVNSWGNNVTTAGYGSLQGPPTYPQSMWYTSSFSGTSSAAGLVAGAILCLQGMVREELGFTLTSQLARHFLNQTGTPSVGYQEVGTRPDIVAARSAALVGSGRVSGVVRDFASGAPLSDIQVVIADQGGGTVTDASGMFSLSALAGDATLRFSSFYFHPDSVATFIPAGGTVGLDVTLLRLPSVNIQGRVKDPGGAPIEDVRVSILGTGVPPRTTDIYGGFVFAAIPRGVTYTVRFDNLAGYGADVAMVDTRLAQNNICEIFQEMPTVSQDFNLSQGDFTVSTSIWAWSLPYRGPGSGFGESPDYCWGVGQAGDYSNLGSGSLISPSYDFSDADSLRLSFHYWCETEPGFDGANLTVSVGGEWQLVTPLSLYSDAYVSALDFQPGWSGDGGGWQGAVFDLTAFKDQPLKFSINFASDENNQGTGFWIDAITWDTGNVMTAVDPGTLVPVAAPILSAHPNPFNPATSISWRMSGAGRLRMAVYDLRGRLVDVLVDREDAPASGSATWRGTDGSGRPVPSGVYFVRMVDGAGSVARRVVTLVK